MFRGASNGVVIKASSCVFTPNVCTVKRIEFVAFIILQTCGETLGKALLIAHAREIDSRVLCYPWLAIDTQL